MKLLVSALETSSNIHLKELKKHLPSSVELFGIFDKSIANPNYDITQLAVMGFVDAIKRLPFFLNLINEMVALAKDADKILLMDSSGFNLPLAKKIKTKYPDKQIIYYILPQAWAWKKGRIPKIEKYCDVLCSILPFEQDYYTKKEKIQYVGHPLLDEITRYKRDTIDSNKIVFMPGSRKTEIQNLMPIYKQLAKKIKDKKIILVIPKHFSQEFIAANYTDISQFEISTDPYEALYEAEFAFICSGTATLEASIIGTPLILSYIAKPFDFFIGKLLVKLEYIGLANIFFSKMGKAPLHNEYLQTEVTVDNLYNGYINTNKEQFVTKGIQLREYLGHGSSKNVATIIMENTYHIQ